MKIKKENSRSTIFLALAGIFVACLVCGNLIFQKFFQLNFFELYTLEISVGLIPYPLTFLVTDIISECYGKQKAQEVVTAGLIASLCVIPITFLADLSPATTWSPINQSTFHQVFKMYGPAVLASLAATTTAQFLDIHVFHFLRDLTQGKHLWLRNNLSTFLSQIVDTSVVVSILFLFGVIHFEQLIPLILNSIIFKLFCAVLDTPLCYLGVTLLKTNQNSRKIFAAS